MTETWPEELDVAEMMDALFDDLSEPLSPGNREQRVAAAQQQVKTIIGALTQSLNKLGGEATSGTDYLTLSSVCDTLRSEIGGQLAEADWASLAGVCKDEREAFNLLSLLPRQPKHDPDDPYEPPLPAWTITLRRCTISKGRIFTEYTRPDRPGADGPTTGITEYRLSKALAFLRSVGIKRLEFGNGGLAPKQQLKWLANAVRKIFIDCDSRWNLVVKATICIPGADTMYTHLSFAEPGTCQIRFEPAPVLVVFSPLTDVGLEKSVLVDRYELKAITEVDGAVWTPVELHQLDSALAKVPPADKAVLRGLTFVRKKTSPEDSEATSEAGSYRFSNRTITLLDAGFSERDYGFIGLGEEIGPYSHWTILHEVGHAVEKYRWEMEYRQWDTAEIEQELSQLNAQKGPQKRITELTLRRAEYTNKQLDMVNELRSNKSSSKCLQAFVSLVGEKKVPPCTGYAFQSWKDKHGEFFAEAYSLFLNDPWYIRKVSEDLYNWFAKGGYQASWQ